MTSCHRSPPSGEYWRSSKPAALAYFLKIPSGDPSSTPPPFSRSRASNLTLPSCSRWRSPCIMLMFCQVYLVRLRSLTQTRSKVSSFSLSPIFLACSMPRSVSSPPWCPYMILSKLANVWPWRTNQKSTQGAAVLALTEEVTTRCTIFCF